MLLRDDPDVARERVKKLFYNEALAQHARRRRDFEHIWWSMNVSFGGRHTGTGYPENSMAAPGTITPGDVESFQPIWEENWKFL